MNITKVRIVLSLGLLAAGLVWGTAAQAQTDATPPSPAQSLSCLQRPEAPSYPAQMEGSAGNWLMRVQLRFEQPDEPPKVDVLFNNASEGLQRRALGYLNGYRLPCLKPSDGVVRAVQEFDFLNSDRDPVPAEILASPQNCMVAPRRDMRPVEMLGDETLHVLVAAVFKGDGDQAPEVKVLYSTAQSDLDKRVVERMSQYRMPCRKSSDEPRVLQQHFVFRPAGVARTELKHEAFSLREFLGMTKGAGQLQAFFDFRTMGCPFKVNYSTYAPALPNEVRVDGPADPNRLPFLQWLRERELKFRNDKVASDLFGSTLQINISCGELNLRPKAQ